MGEFKMTTRLLLLLAVTLARGASSKASTSLVVEISGTEHFKQTLEENDLALVEFYAPWCGHCKRLNPKLDYVSTQLKEMPGVVIAKVDCTTTPNGDLRSQYRVSGFPTVIAFQDGTHWTYKAKRDAPTILEFLKSRHGPAFSEVAALPAALPTDKQSAVVMVGALQPSHLAVFQSAASRHREVYSFLVLIPGEEPTESSSMRAPGMLHAIHWTEAGATLPSVNSSTAAAVLSSKSTFERWIEHHLAPAVVRLSVAGETGHAGALEMSTLPRVLLFPAAKGGAKKLAASTKAVEALEALAERHRGIFRAADVAPTQMELRSQYGVRDDWDTVIVISDQESKYICRKVSLFESCLADYLNGQLPRYYKSRSVVTGVNSMLELSHEEFDRFVPAADDRYVAAVLFYKAGMKAHKKRTGATQDIAAAYATEPHLKIGQYDLHHNDPPQSLEALLSEAPDMTWVLFGGKGPLGTVRDPTLAPFTLLDDLPSFAVEMQRLSSVPLTPVWPTFMAKVQRLLYQQRKVGMVVGLCVVCVCILMWMTSSSKPKPKRSSKLGEVKKEVPTKQRAVGEKEE